MTSVFGVGRTCPPRSLHLGIGRKQFGLRRLPLWLVCVASLLASSASAHDASSYGGVFRSRDLGAAWLNADVGLFLNAALVVAVDPRDSSHLLVGTDLGILSSRNGGRSWIAEARDVIIGGIAVAPNGDVWFGMMRRAGLGRLRNGHIKIFALPRDNARPFSVAVDTDGNVWYADISGFVGMLPARHAGVR
jgi:hypothetical protein